MTTFIEQEPPEAEITEEQSEAEAVAAEYVNQYVEAIPAPAPPQFQYGMADGKVWYGEPVPGQANGPFVEILVLSYDDDENLVSTSTYVKLGVASICWVSELP